MQKSNRVLIAIVSAIVVCFSIWMTNAFALNIKKMPLSVEKAFVFSAVANHPNEITAMWRIAPGYILYTKKLHITLDPAVQTEMKFPRPEVKHEAGEGDTEVYTGKLSVPIKIKGDVKEVKLSVDYQGCSKSGFCYPPIHKEISVNLTTHAATQVNVAGTTSAISAASEFESLLTDQNGVQHILQGQNIFVLMLIFTGIGLLLAFTPCVLPMVPILTSIIVGQKKSVTPKKAFFLSATYVLATSLTYALAGVAAASMGNSLQVWLQKPIIIGCVSALFMLLSLSLFGLYEIRMPSSWQNRLSNLSNQQQGGTYVGVFLMGILSTLIVSPCVTAPLVGVLMYIAHAGSLMLGASALFMMGIGMGIPLVLIGISAGKWLPKSGPWMEAVKMIFAMLMFAMAVWMLSRILPANIETVLWGAYLAIVALVFALHLPKAIGKHQLNRSIGVLMGCSGMLLMIGGVANPDLMKRWIHGNQAVIAVKQFKTIHSVDELSQYLAHAKATHQPVVVDYYADWCESCLAMDRNVFEAADVKKELTNYVLLRIDLTNNTAADQELLKHYEVVAPPTVVFIDAEGREISTQRIVGAVDTKEFLNKLGENWSQLALKD